MLCSEATVVNLGVQEGRAVTLKCRAWSCDLCGPDRRRQLIALGKSGNPNTFITLTVNPESGSGPQARARALADAWRVIVKRAKRRYGYETIPYMCVFEATKKGEPHLHILARCRWLDQRWLSGQMADLTGAPIVDVRRITDPDRTAGYVAKYCGKDPHHFGTCKRYWRTRDYELSHFEREEPPGHWSSVWEIRDCSLEDQEARWIGNHWTTRHEGGVLYGTSHDPSF